MLGNDELPKFQAKEDNGGTLGQGWSGRDGNGGRWVDLGQILEAASI